MSNRSFIVWLNDDDNSLKARAKLNGYSEDVIRKRFRDDRYAFQHFEDCKIYDLKIDAHKQFKHLLSDHILEEWYNRIIDSQELHTV